MFGLDPNIQVKKKKQIKKEEKHKQRRKKMKNIIKTRTSFGAGLTALAFSTIVTSTAFAQTCATVPTCEELGFDKTQRDCVTTPLKCPFDQTKYYCLTADELEDLLPCAIGDILYSDKPVDSCHLLFYMVCSQKKYRAHAGGRGTSHFHKRDGREDEG